MRTLLPVNGTMVDLGGEWVGEGGEVSYEDAAHLTTGDTESPL